MTYTGWLIDAADRSRLLELFPPRYPVVRAHHVTHEVGGTLAPPPAPITIVGRADDDRGVEALLVRVDGKLRRPDGKIYHITWSRNDDRASKESNDVIELHHTWSTVRRVAVLADPFVGGREAPPLSDDFGVAEAIAPTMDAYLRACRALHWRTAQLKAHGIEPLTLHENTPQYPPDNVRWKARHPLHAPCGHTEPESDYRDPDTGAHRTARCEGANGLVVRGNGLDSTSDGTQWMGSRPCPNGNKP